MTVQSSSEPLTNALGAIEPNVVIAGLEGAAVAWIAYAVHTGAPLTPTFPNPWQWFYAIYAVFAVLAIILLGLAVEGLVGLLELLTTPGLLKWSWYKRFVGVVPDSGSAQRWAWKSPQASQEFTRRRLRILTTRSTAFCLLILTLALGFAMCWRGPSFQFGVLALTSMLFTALFVFLWWSAQSGWNNAVREAGEMDCGGRSGSV